MYSHSLDLVKLGEDELLKVRGKDDDRTVTRSTFTQSDLPLLARKSKVISAIWNRCIQGIDAKSGKIEIGKRDVHVSRFSALRSIRLGEEGKTLRREVSGGNRDLVEIARQVTEQTVGHRSHPDFHVRSGQFRFDVSRGEGFETTNHRPAEQGNARNAGEQGNLSYGAPTLTASFIVEKLPSRKVVGMSNDNLNKDYELFTSGSGIAPETGYGLLEITGEDMLEWLQGQATNDIRGVKELAPVSFCLCQPTGQMLAVCRLFLYEDRYFVSTDNRHSVVDRSQKMVILEDVQVRDLTSDWNETTLVGPKSRLFVRDFVSRESIVLMSDQFGKWTCEIWSPSRTPSSKGETSQEAFDAVRLENGVPLRGVDYTEKTLPPELGPAFEAKHVSYNKGCYTGQEVLMRMHSRGHTNKTWVGLLLESPVEGKAKVQMNGEDVGTITSAAMSPEFGAIAGAMLRNEATQEGTVVQVGEVKGRVTQMPIRKN